MSLPEGLGAFTRKDLHVERVAVRKAHDKERTHCFDAIEDDLRVTDVDLRFARRVSKRNEDLALHHLEFGHNAFDQGVTAVVTTLSLESHEEAFGGVALFS